MLEQLLPPVHAQQYSNINYEIHDKLCLGWWRSDRDSSKIHYHDNHSPECKNWIPTRFPPLHSI